MVFKDRHFGYSPYGLKLRVEQRRISPCFERLCKCSDGSPVCELNSLRSVSVRLNLLQITLSSCCPIVVVSRG